MAKLCNEGRTSVGVVYLKGEAQPAFYLGLYKNLTEPAVGAVMTDITEAETPGVSGYARQLLADGAWTEGDPGIFTQAQKTFTAVGGDWGSCYGYFITTAATGTAGKLVAVEQISDGPYVMNAGVSSKITPKLTVR